MADKIIKILMVVLLVSAIGLFVVSYPRTWNNEVPAPSPYFTISEEADINKISYSEDGEILISTHKNLTGGAFAKSIGSGSMFPTIPSDSLLILIPIVGDELVVGDIVSIDEDQSKVIHRIVKITEEGYTTKGDNNNRVDPIIRKREDIDKRLVGILW